MPIPIIFLIWAACVVAWGLCAMRLHKHMNYLRLSMWVGVAIVGLPIFAALCLQLPSAAPEMIIVLGAQLHASFTLLAFRMQSIERLRICTPAAVATSLDHIPMRPNFGVGNDVMPATSRSDALVVPRDSWTAYRMGELRLRLAVFGTLPLLLLTFFVWGVLEMPGGVAGRLVATILACAIAALTIAWGSSPTTALLGVTSGRAIIHVLDPWRPRIVLVPLEALPDVSTDFVEVQSQGADASRVLLFAGTGQETPWASLRDAPVSWRNSFIWGWLGTRCFGTHGRCEREAREER